MKHKHFKLHFKRPLTFKSEAHASKEGVYLYADNSEEPTGEASPLPQYSKESINDVLRELKSFKLPPIEDPYFDYSNLTNLKCLQFALSMMSHQNLITLPSASVVKVQGLLHGSLKDIQEKSLVLQMQNITIAKIKLGRESLSEEKAALEFVFKNTNLTLRLDANQKWRLSEAVEFLKDLPKDRIDYLEEPLKNPKELELLYAKTNIPYALDESLELFRGMTLKGLKAIVLKPTLLGDLQTLRSIISDYTRSSNAEVIISSSYESPIGLDYLKKLALQIHPQGYHGLDTEDALSEVELL